MQTEAHRGIHILRKSEGLYWVIWGKNFQFSTLLNPLEALHSLFADAHGTHAKDSSDEEPGGKLCIAELV